MRACLGSNKCKIAVAKKNFQQSRLFLPLMLDIEWAHADNADCHHTTLSRQYLFSKIVDSLSPFLRRGY